MTTPTNSPHSENRNKTSRFKRVILWVGLACLLQFLVFAGIGVARGYSIQSWAPHWIMLTGVLLLIPFQRTHGMVSFLSSASLLLFALVAISQGWHQDKGDELYKAGKFADARMEFRKETDTWYLRLCYNYHEAPSMDGIARCQSQLEEFGEARETYVAMTSMFRGYYKKRAEEELASLDANLAKVAELEKSLAEEEDDEEKASLLFDLALFYRRLNCARKGIQQYQKIQSLKIDERFKEQARNFIEEL